MKKIIRILNSYQAVCISLSIICVFLIVFNFYVNSNTKVISFGGYNEDVTILNGTIITTMSINRLSSPSIIYSGDDIKLSDYKIGYYVGDEPIVVVSETKKDDITYNLKELLANTDFSFTETHRNANFLSKKNIKNIDKLKFQILGTNAKDESIKIEVPLDITKLTK